MISTLLQWEIEGETFHFILQRHQFTNTWLDSLQFTDSSLTLQCNFSTIQYTFHLHWKDLHFTDTLEKPAFRFTGASVKLHYTLFHIRFSSWTLHWHSDSRKNQKGRKCVEMMKQSVEWRGGVQCEAAVRREGEEGDRRMRARTSVI